MKNSKKKGERDEVEELLRAAEDETLLNLNIDSHLSSSSHHLHPDLHRRFQALKSSPSPSSSIASPKPAAPQRAARTAAAAPATGEKLHDEDDDLMARFAALKASIAPPPPPHDPIRSEDPHLDDDEEEDDDEVAKVIRWAVDAARLDPSPPTDDEDDTDEEEATERTRRACAYVSQCILKGILIVHSNYTFQMKRR